MEKNFHTSKISGDRGGSVGVRQFDVKHKGNTVTCFTKRKDKL